MTRSLIEAAPLVASVPVTTPPAASPTSPSTQPDHSPEKRRRISLKQPALLVLLGGTLATGLLVLTGATQHRRTVTGHPVPAGQGPRAAAPTTPILPPNVPAPAGHLAHGRRFRMTAPRRIHSLHPAPRSPAGHARGGPAAAA
ncbi:hypothetical protein GO986_21845 [Deinococcus sp. HMF7620]|uniref:Uncharacterized protein n=1 Tax=Deinococcus arboris TaxID=2682977 RepID=A0A7C9M4W0_9DEIO|nr:hypothetical protein [Deinococcus arboris]MVN89382.1 hypothetical protein [Deinococcus arboris]